MEDLDAPKLECNIWVRICTDHVSQTAWGGASRAAGGPRGGVGRGGTTGRGVLSGMAAERAVAQG